MIFIWSALPHDVRQLTRPVAAKDYWDRGPVRRYMAKTYNALLVDRKEIKVHQSPVDVMLREIGSTDSLIIFPEGGRTAGETVGEFKSGLYYLSKKRPDWELVPVHIDNMNRVLAARRVSASAVAFVHYVRAADVARGRRVQNSTFLTRARDAVRRLKEVE